MKKKRNILILLLFILVFVLISCLPQELYSLVISTDGNGRYSADPENYYALNVPYITVTAIPNDGYIFIH
ncbi:MAG: hypothetical protein H7A30_02915 [Thermotogae bacterium]|nr:hypothetical protein [Thermotogota bacterium]